MNIYKALNEIIEYIEADLENDIDYNKLSQIMATNEYIMKKVFAMITGVSISEYIRNRRLSNAGFDIYQNNEKIIDIAVKYKYDSSTSFSRAFEKFHGIKPSNAKNTPEKLKNFTKIHFNEDINENFSIEYSIIEMEEKVLYGKGMKTSNSNIHIDAPKFFKEMEDLYVSKYGEINYGVVIYEDRFDSDQYEYWIAYEEEIKEFNKLVIPKSKWIKFIINSNNAEEIQKVSDDFYKKFVPSAKFKFSTLPELEYYHDGITEFLVPFEE